VRAVDDEIVQIDTGYACFGIVVKEGRVVAAPPIAGWCIGRRANEVIEYYLRAKGARIQPSALAPGARDRDQT